MIGSPTLSQGSRRSTATQLNGSPKIAERYTEPDTLRWRGVIEAEDGGGLQLEESKGSFSSSQAWERRKRMPIWEMRALNYRCVCARALVCVRVCVCVCVHVIGECR